jgi:hypothetical protein
MHPTLPYVDEHHVEVAAPVRVVWRAVGDCLPRDAAARVGAAILGTEPRRGPGDPLAIGGTVPGFEVVEAVPNERLVLAGRHRFSAYALTFELRDLGPTTRLTAVTHALFPRLRGRAYRALVIGSGAHRVLTRQWLERIRGTAERRAD